MQNKNAGGLTQDKLDLIKSIWDNELEGAIDYLWESNAQWSMKEAYADALSNETTTDEEWDALLAEWDNQPHPEIRFEIIT